LPRSDNQEVGLEAATLERVRNSSLVECDSADNIPGQSVVPKLWIIKPFLVEGVVVVGERSMGDEARPEGLVDRIEERMPV
jgi:hypothetical protein